MDKDWCANYEILLSNAEEHDTREKIINSIITLIAECGESFRSNRNMISNLRKLKKEYTKVDKNDTDDTYFTGLVTSIDHVLAKIDSKSKDEF